MGGEKPRGMLRSTNARRIEKRGISNAVMRIELLSPRQDRIENGLAFRFGGEHQWGHTEMVGVIRRGPRRQ